MHFSMNYVNTLIIFQIVLSSLKYDQDIPLKNPSSPTLYSRCPRAYINPTNKCTLYLWKTIFSPTTILWDTGTDLPRDVPIKKCNIQSSPVLCKDLCLLFFRFLLFQLPEYKSLLLYFCVYLCFYKNLRKRC